MVSSFISRFQVRDHGSCASKVLDSTVFYFKRCASDEVATAGAVDHHKLQQENCGKG